MFTSDEGEGWQQLGEGLMPNSNQDAGHMLEGFQQMAEQSIHSVFGNASVPDLKDALGAMFGSPAVELDLGGIDKFPGVEFFDSGAGSAPAPAGELSAATGGTGGESAGLQANVQAGAAPSLESGVLQSSPTGAVESAGLHAPAGGVETSALQTGAQAGPGTIETLHAPGIDQATAMSSAPGIDQATAISSAPGIDQATAMSGAPGIDSTGSYFKPMQGAEAATNISDASSPTGDIGKAVTDIMSKMGDMIGSMLQGPMGFLGGLLNFFLNIFSQILSTIGHVMEETARAAAALAADAWKKHLEMATGA